MSSPREHPILFSGAMVGAILEGRKTQSRRVVQPQPTEPLFPMENLVTGEIYWCHPDRDYVPPDRGEIEYRDGTFRPLAVEKVKSWRCPYGQAGDRLWVRETWKCAWTPSCGHGILYAADSHFECFNTLERNRAAGGACGNSALQWIIDHYGNDHRKEPWRPSIHMPRWASRLTPDVVSVRVERLQDISEADAQAEGVDLLPCSYVGRCNSNRCPHHNLRRYALAYERLWDGINAKRGFGWDTNPYVWVISFRRQVPRGGVRVA